MKLVDITSENWEDVIFLSTDPENIVGKHVYEKVGFKPENRMVDDEELYKIVLD